MMYRIEKKPFGYKLTFGDFIDAEEMKKWCEEAKSTLQLHSGPSNVFVDMRSLKPLPAEAQPLIEEGQKAFKEKGMERSVVVLANSLLTMQFKRIAKETGIYEWERYLDSSGVENWEQVGLDWIQKGIDPDA